MKKKIKTNWKKVRSNGKIGILRSAINEWRPKNQKKKENLTLIESALFEYLPTMNIQNPNYSCTIKQGIFLNKNLPTYCICRVFP